MAFKKCLDIYKKLFSQVVSFIVVIFVVMLMKVFPSLISRLYK